MTSIGPRLLTAAMLMGISSCIQPVHQHMTDPPPAEATKPPAGPPKPVRMNGRGKVTSISIQDFFVLQQSGKVLLFDARPAFFYHLGHIPGALSLPKPSCDVEIAKRESEIKAAIAAKTPIVVYCTNLLCPDARTVAIHLADYGYSSSTLTGGWESWKEAGLPTE
jgi:rhodanese-related sulfurtransferase